MHITEKRIEIRAPVGRVFDLFSDFESFPRWMKNIREVRRTGRRMTRWSADAPLGMSVEWEAETTRFEPDRRIAWRSVRGDVDTEGEVVFQETRRGTTMMRVMLGYDPPAGRLGALVARLFGVNPEEQLSEDLERFAQVAEGRGRRARDRRADNRGGPASGPGRAPAAERREYVRMQMERRQRERLERDEPHRYRETQDARDYRERDDERRSGMRERMYEEEYERAPQPRQAMTPRERELERARREMDDEYSKTAFRRGIDRLLDEPPSRDWHRWKRESNDE